MEFVRLPPRFKVEVDGAAGEHQEADDDDATHQPERGAERPVHRRESDCAPREMGNEAAYERAEQQHEQNEHDCATGPFAHARLRQRAAKPGIHDVGEMPGQPEADQPARPVRWTRG